MNTPMHDHPLVGYLYTYHKNLPHYNGEVYEGLVLANGMQVQIKSVFQNWNDVEGLDMLYVYVPETGQCTHIPPRALGLGAIHAEGMRPLVLDWESSEYALDDCAWYNIVHGPARPAWARFDCWGRLAQVGDGKYSVLCEGHHNRQAPGH